MLSSFFITRPKFAIVIAVAIVIAGLVSLAIIPIAQYPNLVPSTINITTTYPGRMPTSSRTLSPNQSRSR